jgi:hypothetical protein
LHDHHDLEILKLIEQTEEHPSYKLVQKVVTRSELLKRQIGERTASAIFGIDFQGCPSYLQNTMPFRTDLSLITIFLLSCPTQMFVSISEHLQMQLLQLKEWKGNWDGKFQVDLLKNEVKHIQEQMDNLMQTYCDTHRTPLFLRQMN